MPIIMLEGPPRSGKSHYSVKYRLLDFIRKKIVTVTNVDGINIDEIAKYLKVDRSEVEPYLKLYSMAEIQKLSDDQKLLYDPDLCPDAVLQPGMHLLIDEAWSLWPADRKLTPIEQKFFPYHGHYKDERGIVTEITIATQDIGQLNKGIRPLVAERVLFEKMTKTGMSNRFQYKIFSGNARRYHRSKIEKYDPKIYDLYHSSSGGGDFTLDERSGSSIFHQPIFKFLALMLLIMPFAVYKAYDIMANGFSKKPLEAVKEETLNSPPLASTTPNAAGSNVQPSTAAVQASEWRLVGTYKKNGLDVALLSDNAGRYRSALITSKTQSVSNSIKVSVDFESLSSTPYTGSAPTNLLGASK